MGPTGSEDLALERRGGAVGTAGGPAGAVGKARRALLAKARQPLVGGGARAAQLVGDIGGAVAGEDPLDQQPSSVNGEAGVSVGHEDLRGVVA